MNIGEAAVACGLSGKTIRYYEEIGLVIPRRQEGNDYRVYSEWEVAQLCLLQQARVAGFSLAECRELLAFYVNVRNGGLDPAPAKSIEQKIMHIDGQIAALHALRDTLISMNRNRPIDSKSVSLVSQLDVENDDAQVTSGLVMSFQLVDEGSTG